MLLLRLWLLGFSAIVFGGSVIIRVGDARVVVRVVLCVF